MMLHQPRGHRQQRTTLCVGYHYGESFLSGAATWKAGIARQAASIATMRG
jgi:hypothetical protein